MAGCATRLSSSACRAQGGLAGAAWALPSREAAGCSSRPQRTEQRGLSHRDSPAAGTPAPCSRRRLWHACPRRDSTPSAWHVCASSSGRVADPVYMKVRPTRSNFRHSSAAQDYLAEVRQRRLEEGCLRGLRLQEYAQLKEYMISTARKAGGGLAAYLLLTVDGEAGLCALIGSAACYVYLQLLFRDVDAFTPDTRIPMFEAEKIQNPTARNVAKVAAAYYHALQPRLLVPVALAAASAAWNQLSGSPIDSAHQGFLLLGFLSYKAPLILKLADDNVTKRYKDDEMSRPLIERFEDELDQFGRPKKALVPLPTEALPDNIDTSNVDLEKLNNLGGMVQMMGFPQRRHLLPGEQEEDGTGVPSAQQAAPSGAVPTRQE